jgi:hypothetical protein
MTPPQNDQPRGQFITIPGRRRWVVGLGWAGGPVGGRLVVGLARAGRPVGVPAAPLAGACPRVGSVRKQRIIAADKHR